MALYTFQNSIYQHTSLIIHAFRIELTFESIGNIWALQHRSVFDKNLIMPLN